VSLPKILDKTCRRPSASRSQIVMAAVIGRTAAPKELENLAPDTWYVNVLAVRPQFRGLALAHGFLPTPTTLQANADIGASALLFPMPIEGRDDSMSAAATKRLPRERWSSKPG
jgi:hypothetical protein